MARRKSTRRRKKTSQTFIIDKYKLGGILITIGFLYFFAYFLAKNAPLMTDFFNKGAFFVFGEIGTLPFFALLTLLGILFIFKGYLIRLLTRQFVLILVTLSGVFNFELIDQGIALNATTDTYLHYGGYAGWPLLWLLDKMFGGAVLPTKIMIALLLVALIVWVLYTLNVTRVLPSLPRLRLPKISLTTYEAPARSSSKKKTSSSRGLFSPREHKHTKESANSLDTDQLQKKLQEKLHATNNSSDSTSISGHKSKEGSLIKSLFKDKVKKEVGQKIAEKIIKKIEYPADKPTFSTSLMDTNDGQIVTLDEATLVQQAQSIQNKLMEFGVQVKVDGFDIGPSVIQLRIRPHAGVKVSAIENLQNDIALSLKTKSLRIIAPIAGTDCVGIQIKNPNASMVHLGDVLDSLPFREAMQSNATNITLGKGIDGQVIVKPLEKMPHLLVAGATGTGKSVGVNDFILSLMYQNSPAELKFLMVDPKQVELEFYSGLPYLLGPIVTQPDKALKLLQRSVDEMETRYSKLKKNKVKNLEEYNKKFPDDKMYRIVFVIDELADLMMMGNKKEVELCITRIAQKARAVGMHLIIATQRPSVNVLTGLIKANIPTRISFGVVSQIDSRTILGVKGGEDLLGRGDLLYMDTTTKTPLRVQAPFVSTAETEKIMQALKDKYMQGVSQEDIYHPEIVNMLEGKVETVNTMSKIDAGGDEELLQQAIVIISETRKASATMLQRKLNVGFARAARLMDMLEERGIVGPQEGARARKILI